MQRDGEMLKEINERYLRSVFRCEDLFEYKTRHGPIDWTRPGQRLLPQCPEGLADYLVREMEHSDADHYGSFEVQLLLSAIHENGVPRQSGVGTVSNFIGKLLLPRLFKAKLSQKFLDRVLEWCGQPCSFYTRNRLGDVELAFHSFKNGI